MRDGLRRSALAWSVVGCAALALLPWYAAADGAAPGKRQLLVPGLALLAALALRNLPARLGRATLGFRLMVLGGGGFVYIAAQGFLLGGQAGLGLGAAVAATSLLMLFAVGLAARGAFKGDVFVAARSSWSRSSSGSSRSIQLSGSC